LIYLVDAVVGLVQAAAGAPELYFVHVDHVGTPRLISDAANQSVWRWDQQEPFGINVPDENPSGLGPFEFSLRFPGQYFDSETNVHYNYHRQYDPSLGRYLQSDPIGLASGINPYLYAAANPLSFIDSLGLELCQVDLPGIGKTYLDSAFAPIVSSWLAANAAVGVNVSVTSAFRTTAQQATLGPAAITPAPASNSLHEAGFAVDIGWRALSAAQQSVVLSNAAAAGLNWGGNFRSPDPVHFFRDPGDRGQAIQDAQERYQSGSANACGCGY
jgi:RHS repeat-associated protein